MPVVVDFWAGWCAPCLVLMPILQKLAEEYQGKFLLAKVDTDKQQAIAAQWGIRSLPTVKLFKNGEVIDEFQGAQPESVIRSILEPHLPRASDALREAARTALQSGNTDRALDILRTALAADPEHLPVKLDLAAALMQSGDLDGAERIIKELPLQQREEKAVTVLSSRLAFARAAQSAPPVAELQKRLASDEADLQARYYLGALHAVKGDYAAAMTQFFEIMKRDRRFKEDIGRRSLLDVFELLGDDHELVHQYRRMMAKLLY